MRQAIFRLITTDAILANLIPAENWFLRGSVPDKPPLRFGLLGYDGVQPRGVGRKVQQVAISAYEERGSYNFVDGVLDRVELIMEEVADFRWANERIAVATFNGRDADLYDDQWTRNFCRSNFAVVGR